MGLLTRVSVVGMLGLQVMADTAAANTDAATSQVSAYMASLITGTAFSSVLSVLETDTSATDAIESIWTSIKEGSSVNAEAVMSAFPTEIKPFYSSLFSMESSILSANGFTTNSSVSTSANSTSTSEESSTPTSEPSTSGPSSTSSQTSSEASPTATGSSAVPMRGEMVGFSAAALAALFAIMLAL